MKIWEKFFITVLISAFGSGAIAAAAWGTWDYLEDGYNDDDNKRVATYSALLDSTNKAYICKAVLPMKFSLTHDARKGLKIQASFDYNSIQDVLKKPSCPQPDNSYAMIGFDGATPTRYQMNPPPKGGRGTYFFPNDPQLLTKIKNSEKMIMQVTFSNNEEFEYSFNTANLVWSK